MSKVRNWLENASPIWFSVYAIIAAFCSYACMYAFRKAFTVGTFTDEAGFWGLNYKEILVITQVLGYMLSKFIGIKVVSEMKTTGRVTSILILIGIAELALLGFATIPRPYNFICLFFNGLPLGMIWGLVFSYLEGRKFTEVMGLGLCASFTFASGFVKDVGKWIISLGASEFWMPFLTGALFAVPLLIFVWMLNQMPPPNEEDIALRTKRAPMSGAERWAFFKRFAVGIILLVVVYTMLTAYRDFRDNFMEDILISLKGKDHGVSFSGIEGPVSLGVLGILMLIVLVKDNVKALRINHIAILLGTMLAGLATYGYHAGWWDEWWWMFLTGYGTYLAYIPFNSILFDRLIASFRYVSNVGFLIYLADSFGYMGSVTVLLYKDFGAADLSWANFFTQLSYGLAIVGFVGTLSSMAYFYWQGQKFKREN
ncbi:MAG: DUF5690 family protein [Bacteroidia bacterium]